MGQVFLLLTEKLLALKGGLAGDNRLQKEKGKWQRIDVQWGFQWQLKVFFLPQV